MSKSPRDSEEIRAWMRALDLRCAKATPVDPERVRALEALVADCNTGFEAWERLVASGFVPVDWLQDDSRRFAVRAAQLARFRRARAESLPVERVAVDGGTHHLAAALPAEKAFAVRLAGRADSLAEAERLARLAAAQLLRFSGDRSGPQGDPRVLWRHGAPAIRAHLTTRVGRSMQSRLALVYSAMAIPAMNSAERAWALVNRVRSLDWQFAKGEPGLHCAMQRERWQLVLDAFAPYAGPDGAIEESVDLAGLDGMKTLRIEPHERENPFVALAALEALGVTLSAMGAEWIELSVPGFSGV